MSSSLIFTFRLGPLQFAHHEINQHWPTFEIVIQLWCFTRAGITQDLDSRINVSVPTVHFSPWSEDVWSLLIRLKIDLWSLLKDKVGILKIALWINIFIFLVLEIFCKANPDFGIITNCLLRVNVLDGSWINLGFYFLVFKIITQLDSCKPLFDIIRVDIQSNVTKHKCSSLKKARNSEKLKFLNSRQVNWF